MYIYPLSRIHNISLTSAYFGPDNPVFRSLDLKLLIFDILILYACWLLTASYYCPLNVSSSLYLCITIKIFHFIPFHVPSSTHFGKTWASRAQI
jgi:hypothetical protein